MSKPLLTPERIRLNAGIYCIAKCARLSKIDRDTLARYESGKLKFLQFSTMDHWKRIACVCGVNYEQYRAAVLDLRQRVLKK